MYLRFLVTVPTAQKNVVKYVLTECGYEGGYVETPVPFDLSLEDGVFTTLEGLVKDDLVGRMLANHMSAHMEMNELGTGAMSLFYLYDYPREGEHLHLRDVDPIIYE